MHTHKFAEIASRTSCRRQKVGEPDLPGALEHFRSTGIRDGYEPNAGKYESFAACSEYDGKAGEFSRIDIEECCNLVWDNEKRERGSPATCGPTFGVASAASAASPKGCRPV